MIVGPGYAAEPLSPTQAVANGPYAFPQHIQSKLGAMKLYAGTKLLRERDLRDGAHQTINLVECDSIGSSWLEPTDLVLDGTVDGVAKLLEGAKKHREGLNVGWCSRDCTFLRPDNSVDVVHACLTRAGGEGLKRDALKYSIWQGMID